MAFLQSNGIRMFYESHGAGDPLILISGLGGDHTFWNAALERLSARYRVIVYDTRGIGQTDAPEAPYTMKTFAADLAGLMDALGIPAAHLLGFSMGGNIALQFARDHPHRVRRLILAATHAAVPAQIRHYVDAVLDAYERSSSPRLMYDLIAPFLFSNRFLEDPANAGFLRYDEEDPYPQPLYAWKNQYFAQREFDMRDELHRIAAPALILHASEDPFAPHDSATALRDGIRDAGLVCFQGSGHLINLEQPELFYESVLRFLDARRETDFPG